MILFHILFILSANQGGGPILMEFGPKSFIDPTKYVLQPNDRLLIIIKGNISYSFQTFVTPDGKIPLYRINLAAPTLNAQNLISPLTGSEQILDIEGIINAEGKTLRDVKDTIDGFYNKIYDNIEVELSLIEGRKTYIYVEGEMYFPGAFSYYSDMDIDDYIGLAGGTLENADVKGIYVIIGNKKMENVKGIKLLKGDKIIIPKNRIKEYLPLIHTGVAVLYSIVLTAWYSYNIWLKWRSP